MDVGQISVSKYLRPLKISLPSIPHITIETNQTCNLHCKTCYNIYQDTIKSLDDTFRHFLEHKINFALSLPVYNDNPGKIPGIMRSYAGYSFFDGVLATIERKIPFVVQPSCAGDAIDYLYTEYHEINTTLNITPTTYLPSNNSDEEISWLIYFYYINSVTGFCMEASGKINHVFRKIYKFLKGKEFFAVTVPAGLYFLNILVSISFEFFFNPLKIKNIIKLVRTSRGLSKLRYQYIVVQDGPYFDNNRHALRMCYHCPDATIRNGKITPVCVADLINPLKKDIVLNEEQRQIYREVYHHLEQLQE